MKKAFLLRLLAGILCSVSAHAQMSIGLKAGPTCSGVARSSPDVQDSYRVGWQAGLFGNR